MGSKQHILPVLQQIIGEGKGRTALDAFSGSGCVAYMLKQAGFRVIANDYLSFPYITAHALIENNSIRLEPADIATLLSPHPQPGAFIQTTYQGLYFTDAENHWLDNTLAHACDLPGYKKSLALAALARACIKKRPRGVFTYTGFRYNDGRRDLRLSLVEQFVAAIQALNAAVINNGQLNRAFCSDIFHLPIETDLVYLDPPYYTPHSDNDYLRRYHFVEGICRQWRGVEILYQTKTRKLRKIPTPFASKSQIHLAFQQLFHKFRHSTIVLSYSSNGLPTRDELLAMLRTLGKQVELVEIPHRYSFGTHAHKQHNPHNKVHEYLFLAY